MDTRRLLSYVRRAVDDFQMIAEGDKICVGISGGKDSLALLAGLAGLRHFYPKKFDLVALTVDMGFDGVDYSEIEALCRELDVPYHVKKTEIAQIIFDIRKEKILARFAPRCVAVCCTPPPRSLGATRSPSATTSTMWSRPLC